MAAILNAPPAYFAQTPGYGSQSAPMYSDTPGASERILASALSSPVTGTLTRTDTNRSLETDFVYKTDHMEVNLGSRLWGLRTPTYGSQGHVEGSVKLLEEQAHVTCVRARLRGSIVVTTSNFGQVAGQQTIRFLQLSSMLYSSSRGTESSTPWSGEHRFSFALPSHVDIKGKRTSLPASFTTHLPSTYCEIFYLLKVDMTRRGFRRHEVLSIPLSYLPKSRPSQPSIMDIPWPLGNSAGNPFQGHESVRTETLSEYWPCQSSSPVKSDPLNSQSIYLSLPSPSSFTSGEYIPFMISLSFPHAPALPALLTPNIRIELIKRTRISRFGGLETAMQEISVGCADIRNIKEVAAGVTHLSGVIQAGRPGRENSWKIYAMADVQYIVRTIIQPPKSMINNVATWKNDTEVQMTTDLWGTLERELIATGGIPTPALALAPRSNPMAFLI